MKTPATWWPEQEMALGGTGFVLALVLLLLLAFSLPRERRRLVRTPLVSILIFVVLEGTRLVLPNGPWAQPLRVIAVFFLLFTAGRGLFLLLFESRFSGRLLGSVPRIFRDIIQVLIYLGVLMITFRVAGAEPGSLLTTSALITAVIGLSLQETLGNLFSGLALEAQRPFEVGDWVMFDGDQNTTGQVVEMNWRATKVVSLERVEVIVPNSTIAKAALRNFTKPTPVLRRSVKVDVAYGITPERVKQALLSALSGVPKALPLPPPVVILLEFGDSGVTYVLRYFTDDYQQADVTDGRVREQIWYVFQRQGITIPFPQRDVHVMQVSEASKQQDETRNVELRDAALRNVDLFHILSAQEHRQLAEQTQTHLFTAGETIISQGEEGSELFLIMRGEVAILMQQNGRDSTEVARLSKGQFFGEMSLMTGQARNATVRAISECELLVVGHEPFRRVLDARPDLAERLSEMLAHRQRELAESSRDSMRTRASREEQTSKQLLERIREFFSL